MLAALRESLRAWFLSQELEDDPRHVRGRGRQGETRRFTGARRLEGPLRSDATLPPRFSPPLEALEGRCADHLWILTPLLHEHWQQALQKGQEGLILTFDLESCQYSQRLEQTLRAGAHHWSGRFSLLRVRLGSRMEKRWLRLLVLGDGGLRLTSLPMVLVLNVQPQGLSLRSVALSPLSPGNDQPALQALLQGTPQLAPGTEHERIYLWSGQDRLELSQENRFSAPWTLRFTEAAP